MNGPTGAGDRTREGESLPPLSMKDFQVYNRLSVQMDQFVSIFRSTLRTKRRLTDTAQPFPPRLERPPKRLRPHWQTKTPPPTHPNRPCLLLPTRLPPLHRRTARLPRPREENARVPQGIGPPATA